MGSWGTGTFDNDTACDWAYGLERTQDLSLVREAIEKILAQGRARIDASRAEEALAACEVIARLEGNWGTRNSYSRNVDVWVLAHPKLAPPRELVQDALNAIDRIMSAPSELVQLWDETSDAEGAAEWRAAVADLRARVAR
jgi:hypothetical protein